MFYRCSSKKQFSLLVNFFCLFLLVSIIQGCTTASDAAFQTFKSAFQNTSSQINQAILNPEFRYLRVNIAGLDALMVKGYLDKDRNGEIEIWYSSDGSVMRFQQGRYLGSVGLDTNWQNVSFKNPPRLEQIVSYFDRPNPSPKISSVNAFYPTEQYFYSRNHTLIPARKTILDESISASVSRNTPQLIPKNFLPYLQSKELIWVTEQTSQSISDKKSSPISWYGFQKTNNQYSLVVGQQCLTMDFCITWMPWPVQ